MASRRGYLSLLAGGSIGIVGSDQLFKPQSYEIAPALNGSRSSQIADTAARVADEIDRHRKLPDEIVLDQKTISSAQFCRAAMKKVVELRTEETVEPKLPKSVVAPENPYPDISLSASAYGTILKTDDYVTLFKRLLGEKMDAFPGRISLQDKSIRYVDLIHLAASTLRFYDLYEYLPSSLEVKVTSTIGLLPWETPRKYSKYTNALDSDYAHEGFDTVNDRNRVRYYGHRAMRFEMLSLAMEIIGDTTDPYTAANRLFSWVLNSWSPYYTSSINTMGDFLSAQENIRYFMHTSAVPSFEITSLFRAAGIPAKAYTDGPKAYFPSRGWKEFHVHDSDSYWHEDIGFQSELPLPRNADLLISNMRPILKRGRKPDIPGSRSIWINPRDVVSRDIEKLVGNLAAAGYDRLILTVKPGSGSLHYDSTNYSDRAVSDALGDLLTASTDQKIDVAAAVNVLLDLDSGNRNPDWKSVDWQGKTTNGKINLTSSDYEKYITDVLEEIADDYEIDEITLVHHYDNRVGSLNEETAKKFHEDTGSKLEEQYDFEERQISEKLLQWKMQYTREYAGRLKDAVSSIRDIPITYASYPIPGGYYRLDGVSSLPNGFKTYDTLGPYGAGYHFLPDHITKLSEMLDEILMIHATTAWQIGSGIDVVESYFSEFSEKTAEQLSASYHVSNEWEFPSEYLHGLHWYANDKHGISDVNFHAGLSSEGNEGRAFTTTHLTKVQNITPVPKPLFEITDTAISTDHLQLDEQLEVTVTVRNKGVTEGSFEVNLTANGTDIMTKNITLASEMTDQVIFRHQFDEPGEYDITVNDQQEYAITVSVNTPTATPTSTTTPTTTPTPTATPTETSTETPTKSSTETHTSIEIPSDTSAATETESPGLPGFDVVTALGGIGSAISYLLYRTNDSDQERDA